VDTIAMEHPKRVGRRRHDYELKAKVLSECNKPMPAKPLYDTRWISRLPWACSI
jgi:hypothetical protein